MQLAPMFSAIKVKGQKLYEAARRGEEIERQARPVHVSKFVIKRRQHDPQELMYLINCSKGTYVRTLADDLVRRYAASGDEGGYADQRPGCTYSLPWFTVSVQLACGLPDGVCQEAIHGVPSCQGV